MRTVEDAVSVPAGRLVRIAGILRSLLFVERLQITLDKEPLFVVKVLGPSVGRSLRVWLAGI